MREKIFCFLVVAQLVTGLRVLGCCAVAGGGRHVVNADQTVIMIWDQARQTQHFIRKADFRTDAADVGFLVPSPSRPQLDECDNAAFIKLAEITAPPVRRGGGIPLGCSVAEPAAQYRSVRVIEEKRVAGFDATVLTARSGEDLVAWLKEHGYAYSPQVAAWAAPYLTGDWHFTALKVVKDADARSDKDLKAAGDVYFSRDDDQRALQRQAAVTGNSTDAVFLAILAAGVVMPLWKRRLM